ncbi:MAG: HigA family addiction module antitoxin [Ferruginibacter sp.]
MPGDSILETLEHLKMSQAELAERMGKTPSKINDIISSKEPITVNTALQLEKVLGIEAQFWLNRETQYREKLSRIEQEEALEDSYNWARFQPVKILKQYGYLKEDVGRSGLVSELLQFYGVASPIQWQTVYLDEFVSASFRKSSIYETALSSMSAWLRIGEIEMRKFNLATYSKESFKDNLILIRHIVRKNPEDFADQLQTLCLKAGVALVYTMCIPKAPISGAARWFGGNPLIQLTDRFKTNDHFWFTFFHEAGHIMLHGKKDVFIEEFEAYTPDKKKEEEANEFAEKNLIPKDILTSLPEKITERTVREIARKQDTHPAIILSFLQKKDRIPYSQFNNLKSKVILENVINKNH